MKQGKNKTPVFISAFIDFIFPKICIVSGKRIPERNSNKYVHDDILSSVERITDDELIEFRVKVNADRHFSHFSFSRDDNFARIIYHLKYRSMKKLGIFLGSVTGYELLIYLEENSLTGFDYLAPVPLHKTKLRERGYNQSEYICKGIAEQIEPEIIPDLIIRTRNTKSQTMLSLRERQYNVKDAFAVNKKYSDGFLKDKKVILVDDIVTTGSTLNEIIKVLRKEGCSEILCCTLAIARN